MMRNFSFLILSGILIAACNNTPRPKKPDPVRRKSPIAIANITYKPTNTYVKIVYGQPQKQGRTIFGDLVPYGKIWRTGANEATELTTTKPLLINGKPLDAGTYEVFTIPGRQKWTIVLNDSLGQWGAFDYKKKYDHLRTAVPAEQAEQVTESFTIQFSDIEGNTSAIEMQWDTTKISIPVKFKSAFTDQSSAMHFKRPLKNQEFCSRSKPERI